MNWSLETILLYAGAALCALSLLAVSAKEGKPVFP